VIGSSLCPIAEESVEIGMIFNVEQELHVPTEVLHAI
jgi:hypothetical protein